MFIYWYCAQQLERFHPRHVFLISSKSGWKSNICFMAGVTNALIRHGRANIKNWQCQTFVMSMKDPGCSLRCFPAMLGDSKHIRWDKLWGKAALHHIKKETTHGLSSGVVRRRDNDGAKNLRAWLMTMAWPCLVTAPYLLERVADTQTPTEKDTHCSLCLSHPLRAEQKSIHHRHCLREAVYEKDLWKHQGTSVIHAPAAGV